MRFPARLHNALPHISSWMTANRLTLNSAKTEFLFIGLKQKKARQIHNSSFNTETQKSAKRFKNKKNVEHDISACPAAPRGRFFK